MSDVRVSNREIYDLVLQVDRKLTEHMAATNVRLTHLEDKAARPWQLWLAVVGSVVAVPVSVWAALGGA